MLGLQEEAVRFVQDGVTLVEAMPIEGIAFLLENEHGRHKVVIRTWETNEEGREQNYGYFVSERPEDHLLIKLLDEHNEAIDEKILTLLEAYVQEKKEDEE